MEKKIKTDFTSRQSSQISKKSTQLAALAASNMQTNIDYSYSYINFLN